MKKTIKLFLLLCLILGLQGAALARTGQGIYEAKTFFVSHFCFTVDENNKREINSDTITNSYRHNNSPVEKIEAVELSLYKYKLNPPYEETKPQYRFGLLLKKKPNNDYIISHTKPIKIIYTSKNKERKSITLGGSNEHAEILNKIFAYRYLDNIDIVQIEQLKNAIKITAELKTTNNKTIKIDFPPEIIAEWQSIIKHDLSGIT